ncbi:hypothetical protein [Paenibacillus flagellatus]|uniref:Uncharacterized protein n=1 Tax=Paenibacillus flagellatus TaxID=2211139 RepID=A0A2V5K3S3_9BACL|nr:hypothetical protein [Paenibacillus flagellatus]PYI53871.1 hypothetical protein DLM86_15050 [Paenibacillus flagellatus]
MAFPVFVGLTIIAMLTFVVARKPVHLFEIIVLWCTSLQIVDNYIGLLGDDYKLIIPSSDVLGFLAFDSIRSFLVPAVSIPAIGFASTRRRAAAKWAAGAVLVAVLVGIELLAERMNVLDFAPSWRRWWSVAFWTGYVIAMFAIRALYRKVLRKEVNGLP